MKWPLSIILIVITLSASSQSTRKHNLPDNYTYNYHLSFYVWKFDFSRKKDTIRITDTNGQYIKDSIGNYSSIVEEDTNDYTLSYPVPRCFDSSLLVLTNDSGKQVPVVSYDIMYICYKCQPLVIKNYDSWLNNQAVTVLNNAKPGDRIYIRRITISDAGLKRKIMLPSVPIKCRIESKD